MVQFRQTGDDELTLSPSPPSTPTRTDNQSVITPSPAKCKNAKRNKVLLNKKRKRSNYVRKSPARKRKVLEWSNHSKTERRPKKGTSVTAVHVDEDILDIDEVVSDGDDDHDKIGSDREDDRDEVGSDGEMMGSD